ncbi:MAG: SBBP repeat-containing protein, partial [Deltaproteobacteria bacterium]|nr:SBBP repeat-containing protein [Deltaproteobacteria bacterium]
GGTGADRGFSLTADGLGDVYVTGLFNGSATFGLGEANQTTLNSAGGDDVFVAKLDFNGLLQWVTRAGGTGTDGGFGIAVDGLGNSYVTGFFNGITHPGTATFGLGEANETTLISAGDRDIFVAKYGSNGLLQWAKGAGAGGPSTDQGMSLALDGAGGVYVSGYFGDNAAAASATFGLGEVNQTTLTSAGGTDIFLAKFSGN